jgi:hypothetical protein
LSNTTQIGFDGAGRSKTSWRASIVTRVLRAAARIAHLDVDRNGEDARRAVSGFWTCSTWTCTRAVGFVPVQRTSNSG